MSGVTATKTESYTYGDSNWKDKLTAFGRSQFAYDAIGNPTSYKGYTLTWQNGRQLASLEFGPIRLEYTYDVDGLRTSKNVANVEQMHKYYYAGSRLQYETIGETEALMYFYDADGNPSGIRYINGEEADDYYFVCNWRGDVMQVYNASGVLVASYEYDAWGKVIAEKSTDADTQNIAELNPIRYRGYYFNTETRLYYLKSRYYDPAIRRFVNADGYVATGQSILGNNMFSYCDNNPVNREDSTGHLWKQLKAKVKNAWNGFKSWANRTFGTEFSSKSQSKVPRVKKDLKIFSYEYGNKTTYTCSDNSQSKRVSVYGDFTSSNIEEMSLDIGRKLNFSDICNLEIGTNLSNISISATYGDNNSTLYADLDRLKLGFTQSTTIRWDNGASIEEYYSVEVDITTILMMYFSKSFAPGMEGFPYGNPVPTY